MTINHLSFTKEQIILFTDFVKANQSIINLALYHCSIGDFGAGVITEFLKTNKNIEYIELAKAEIYDQGASKLIDSMINHPSLKSINLEKNHITDEMASEICHLIKENKNITNVNLSHNSLTKKGIRHIIDTLVATSKEHDAIRHIDLRQNNFQSYHFQSEMQNKLSECHNKIQLTIDGGAGRKEKIYENVALTVGTFGLWSPIPIYKMTKNIANRISYKEKYYKKDNAIDLVNMSHDEVEKNDPFILPKNIT